MPVPYLAMEWNVHFQVLPNIYSEGTCNEEKEIL
jgi:hypothetical protein